MVSAQTATFRGFHWSAAAALPNIRCGKVQVQVQAQARRVYTVSVQHQLPVQLLHMVATAQSDRSLRPCHVAPIAAMAQLRH